ncbi:MAG: glycosyltransferase family 4 protein [Bacteroidota bacterium]
MKKVCFVLAYPIYHDFWTIEQWLEIKNQNRWIAGILARFGYDVEFWIVDHKPGVYTSTLEGFPDYTVRAFEATKKGKQTKFDYSDTMVEYAFNHPPDALLIKGVDGGIGDRLIRSFCNPTHTPYVMVIGGAYHHPNNAKAKAILHESNYQKEKLIRPWPYFWRKPVQEEKLFQYHKSIDINRFAPLPVKEKKYDAITVSRIVKRNKRFDEIGELSNHARVAIVGDGPYREELQKRYPNAIWLGKVMNDNIPELLNQSKTYIHPSVKEWIITRDFYPRTIGEALACGVPCIGFEDAIQDDIIPSACGMLIKRSDVVPACTALFKKPEILAQMSEAARTHARQHLHINSAEEPLRKALTFAGLL